MRPTERGGPEPITSFTVPEISPSFFLITSLVRMVSDSMVLYGREVVSFGYEATVLLQGRVQEVFSQRPLPPPRGTLTAPQPLQRAQQPEGRHVETL